MPQSKQEVVSAGIDPSLTNTGVSILLPNRDPILELVKFPKLRGPWRLIAIREAVMEILKPHDIAMAAFEGYSYNSVGKWFDLGEVGGVLKVELMLAGIHSLIVPPASLKKFVTNNGQANKKRMVREVNQHYHVGPKEITNDNIADAFGLAHFAYVAATGQSTRRCELEAVKSLRKGNDKKNKLVFKKFWVEI
jgi:Holliday junction resolvasome RuvABC endonuclease subunit